MNEQIANLKADFRTKFIDAQNALDAYASADSVLLNAKSRLQAALLDAEGYKGKVVKSPGRSRGFLVDSCTVNPVTLEIETLHGLAINQRGDAGKTRAATFASNITSVECFTGAVLS